MRRSELVRRIARIPPPEPARRELEQVAAPAEAAADLLLAALAAEDLEGRTVADLGSGTGRLAIGAAILGARAVTAVEIDPALVERAREAAQKAGVEVSFETRGVAGWCEPVDTVVMNPPFGAQFRHADRPFWTAALTAARRAVYAFALADSRAFVAAIAREAGAQVDARRPIPWSLPRTFAHHVRERRSIEVDLWALRIGAPRAMARSGPHGRHLPSRPV